MNLAGYQPAAGFHPAPHQTAGRDVPRRSGDLPHNWRYRLRRWKLPSNPYTEPHRPFKVVYSSLYANVTPSFVVDITAQFERRMEALLSYRSQYGEMDEASGLFPQEQEIRERLAAREGDDAGGRYRRDGRAEFLI